MSVNISVFNILIGLEIFESLDAIRVRSWIPLRELHLLVS